MTTTGQSAEWFEVTSRFAAWGRMYFREKDGAYRFEWVDNRHPPVEFPRLDIMRAHLQAMIEA